MIPFKDSPLTLVDDVVLNTYPEYNRSLYDAIYEEPLNNLFDYTTTYKDGTIISGPSNNRYPDYRCALERMSDKYTDYEKLESIKFALDQTKIKYNLHAKDLNPTLIIKDHSAYLGNKVIISNIDTIDITIPKGTKLYISSILYGKPVDYNDSMGSKPGVKWVIKNSPNPIIIGKTIFTPVDNLNRL